VRGTSSEVLAHFQAKGVKGEFVVIVSGQAKGSGGKCRLPSEM
jgi:hypothetical protein